LLDSVLSTNAKLSSSRKRWTTENATPPNRPKTRPLVLVEVVAEERLRPNLARLVCWGPSLAGLRLVRLLIRRSQQLPSRPDRRRQRHTVAEITTTATMARHHDLQPHPEGRLLDLPFSTPLTQTGAKSLATNYRPKVSPTTSSRTTKNSSLAFYKRKRASERANKPTALLIRHPRVPTIELLLHHLAASSDPIAVGPLGPAPLRLRHHRLVAPRVVVTALETRTASHRDAMLHRLRFPMPAS